MNKEYKGLFYLTLLTVTFLMSGYYVKDIYVAKYQGTTCHTVNNYYKKDTVINKVFKDTIIKNIVKESKCSIAYTDVDNSIFSKKQYGVIGNVNKVDNIEFEICFDRPNQPHIKKNDKSKGDNKKMCDIKNVGRLGYYGYIEPNVWKKLHSSKREIYINRYITRFWSKAHEIGKKEGVNPLIILSRCARESRYNTSKLSNLENNLACIKYRKPSGYFDHEVYTSATRSGKYCDDDCDDTFYSWKTKSESIEAMCHFLQQKRYKKHLKGSSVRSWANALCEGNYSTDCDWENDYFTAKNIVKRAAILGFKLDPLVKID